MYIFVGALLSAMLSCVLLINDIFKLFERDIEGRFVINSDKISAVIIGFFISVIMTVVVVALVSHI